jgi:hypothetical protein
VARRGSDDSRRGAELAEEELREFSCSSALRAESVFLVSEGLPCRDRLQRKLTALGEGQTENR